MMRAAQVARLLLVLVIGSSCSAADAQATVEPKKCTIVNCPVDPCSVTKCNPLNRAWRCRPNYCGGCKTEWVYGSNTTFVLTIPTCPPDSCPAIVDPVCGVDKKTYSSTCQAHINGVPVLYDLPCSCPNVVAPVCGADGVNYRSTCLAIYTGTTVAYAGKCLFPIKCAKTNLKYAPVCDPATKLTWTNACTAMLNEVGKPVNDACRFGPCTTCTPTSGCNKAHRCKGNANYTCEQRACKISHILDTGRRAFYAPCSPIYKNKLTGYPAAACYS